MPTTTAMQTTTTTVGVRLASTRSRGNSRGNSRAVRPRPRATTEDENGGDSASPSSSPEYGRNPLTGEPLEAKGQFTAVVTGIVSVALAVGYLALAQVLDSRDMAPPPPEALGDGSARPADEIRGGR